MDLIRKITLSVTGALFLSGVSSAFADHSWGPYHWARTNNPFTLQVVDSVTAFWWPELDAALARWADAESLELQITKTENDETTRLNCPMVTGKARICNANYGNTGWMGLATVGVDSTGHVDRGVTRINDYFSAHWGSQSTKNKVVCHEVGHLFGLGHTSEDGSSQATCMDYSFGTASQFPNAHDYDLLDNTLYAHLDNHNSYNDSLDDFTGGGDTGGSTGGDTGGSTGGDSTGGDTGGTTTGGDTTGGDTGGSEPCSGKGADKDCNGIPDHKEGGDTTGDTGGSGSTSGCSGKGNDKNCDGIPDNKQLSSDTTDDSSAEKGQKWVSHLPPLGTRVAQSKRGEVWVSSRADGGLWIHHVLLAEEVENPNRGAGNNDHDHGAHQH